MIKDLVIIALLAFAVYANALGNGFVSDDIPAIVENPYIGNIAAGNSISDYINSLVYMVSGLNPVPYRLVNILIHVINSLLVYFLLLLFFRQPSALFGALIFAVHPVHCEAVAWISGRTHLFTGFFVLLPFLLYHAATSGTRLKVTWLTASLITYLCGLFSSPPFILFFPVMLVAYDCTFARWRRTWRLWFLFIMVIALKVPFILSATKDRIGALDNTATQHGLSNPVFNMAYSLFYHLYLILWPARLTIYHEPCLCSFYLLILELAAMVVMILLLPVLFRRAKTPFFAAVIFILFLVPTFSPVMICWLIAERYLYLPSVAFSMFAAFIIDKYVSRAKPALSKAVYLGLIILIAVYSCRTIIRNFDWKDHACIWRATMRVSPYSPKAHNNMGDVYCREGNLDKAALEFQRAIELEPGYADAYHNLANTYEAMGKTDEAIEDYRMALSLDPNLYQSRLRLNALMEKKQEKGGVRPVH